MDRCDVAVVGAGLAGLVCARSLWRAGLDVQVWDSSDAVGGRVRTDHIDGFTMDRGFQVLSTAYPEARAALDLDRLDLCAFDRALLLHHSGATMRLADPLREPWTTPALIRSPIGGVRDKIALGAYAAATGSLPARVLKARSDEPAEVAWRTEGLSGAPVDRLLRPFFSGVVLEHEIRTSRRFVDLMTRMLVRGRSAVPAAGMQAIPEQIAEDIPSERLHLGEPVRRASSTQVETDDGVVETSAVVVATDADAAASLVPGSLDPPSWKGVTTIYHATSEPPLQEATLLVDADPSPVNNVIVVTAAAPSYAADGRALVATSIVHGNGVERVGEAEVRARLATLFRTSTSGWEHVATYDVPRALPAMPAPHIFRKPVTISRAGERLYVCGDHRDTSSIQGALVSGRRAASAVLNDLGRAASDAPDV